MLIKIQPDATVSRYLFTAKSLYMFRVSQHPLSGVLKTVTATSSTGHNTGTASTLQRGLIGTGLWVARLVTSNCCIPVIDTLKGNGVVFLSCEIIQLLCLGLCIVKAVHKFDFRHVTNDKHNVIQWRRLVFSTETLCLLRPPSPVLRQSPGSAGSTACTWDWDSTKFCTHYRVKIKLWLDIRSRISEMQQRAFRHTATDVMGKFAASKFDVWTMGLQPFMAMDHTRYCGLVRGSRVKKER